MFETILLLWIKYKVGTIRGISSDATADAIFNIYDKQQDNKVDKFCVLNTGIERRTVIN